jgi:hypothetical protein
VITRWVLLLPLIGLLSACAAVPTGPTVMVLPGGWASPSTNSRWTTWPAGNSPRRKPAFHRERPGHSARSTRLF